MKYIILSTAKSPTADMQPSGNVFSGMEGLIFTSSRKTLSNTHTTVSPESILKWQFCENIIYDILPNVRNNVPFYFQFQIKVTS